MGKVSGECIELSRHVLSKAMQPGSLVIVDSTGLKVYGKENGIKRNTRSPLAEPGESCILRSMRTTRSLLAN